MVPTMAKPRILFIAIFGGADLNLPLLIGERRRHSERLRSCEGVGLHSKSTTQGGGMNYVEKAYRVRARFCQNFAFRI